MEVGNDRFCRIRIKKTILIKKHKEFFQLYLHIFFLRNKNR